MEKRIKDKINNIISFAFILISLVLLVIGLTQMRKKNTRTTTSPVEEMNIDSLDKVNTKLIIEVENLDSIKDAKIIEVKTLDNDSTLKLFYQLIRKE